jgi:hypothetical protein
MTDPIRSREAHNTHDHDDTNTLVDVEKRQPLSRGPNHELDSHIAKAEARPLYVDLSFVDGHAAAKSKNDRARVDAVGPNATFAVGAKPDGKGLKVASEAMVSAGGAEVTMPAPHLELVKNGMLGETVKEVAKKHVDATVSAGVSKGLGAGSRFGVKIDGGKLEVAGHASVGWFTGGYKVQIKL